MKALLPILCWLLPLAVFAQADSVLNNSKPQAAKPEILSGGFIDFIQTGQMNASARLFRIYIGEPGKFQLPISIFTGVSANNLAFQRQNEDFTGNLINPGAGIFSLSFDGTNRMAGGKSRLTSLQVQYQSGFRFLSIYDRSNYRNITFFNVIAAAGLTLITGAWEKNKAGNMGVFWLNVRGLFSNNPPALLQSLLQDVTVQHNLLGYSVGMGVEISQTVNIKAFYFRYSNNQHIPAFRQPVLQLSFNYSMR